MMRGFSLGVSIVVASMGAAAADPPRLATEQDLALLAGRKYAIVKQELVRIGLHQSTGQACRVFVTADSVRPIETPFVADGKPFTLPYASFMMWSSDRRFDEAVMYHVFSPAEQLYREPQTLQPGVLNPKQAVKVTLAPRQPFPSAGDAALAATDLAKGPLVEAGGPDPRRFTVQPFGFPTQNDDPASVFPHKTESTLQSACLIDPDRVTNCLCAGTE